MRGEPGKVLSPAIDHYRSNPLVHRDRRLFLSDSDWVRSFACEDLRPLIVCRGPVRKEALDVFAEMGITHFGMLLSEKDSIVYPRALAPELRQITDPSRVHRVPDYTGATREERVERMGQIIAIARDNGYDAIFAGYGFMSEDGDFVAAIEAAGLRFIGPRSSVQARAGKKDEAKRTALAAGVSVTPGIDDVSARTLLRKCPDRAAILALAAARDLDAAAIDTAANGASTLSATPPGASDFEISEVGSSGLHALAEAALAASYAAGVDLISTDELCAQVQAEVEAMFRKHPGSRVRIKAIGGGGGKGQRILGASLLGRRDLAGTAGDEAIKNAVAEAPGLVREVLGEVKATGVGDNKNVLIELNIEQTRHNEIQLLGNGQWCVSLGGRDCSLQMHEQKLLEVSVTQEGLEAAIAKARADGETAKAEALEGDLGVLVRMEADAERFGAAVGLDSASTFECIVDGQGYFFMEVNTRIQVEHRVTELCYSLRFRNPDDPEDCFVVESLVEAMALIARHGTRLPKPERIPRFSASVEARLNATDASLSPSAGGSIRYWSKPIQGEIRDDQGICLVNPDTGQFIRYLVSGAYDSNIALLLTTGGNRRASYERLAEVIRSTTIDGTGLQTNLAFHFGLVNWFLGRDVWAKPTTRFVVPYLTMVGALKEEAGRIDAFHAFSLVKKHYARLIEGMYPGDAQAARTMAAVLDRKHTLVTRPMVRLLEDPHLLSGWLSMNTRNFRFDSGKVVWLRNPLGVLNETYVFLHMQHRPHRPAADIIWDHDNELLKEALEFYRSLREHFGFAKEEYFKLNDLLMSEEPQGGYDGATWTEIRAAHFGFEAGLEPLGMLFLVGERVGFWELRVEDNLEIAIPERLLDPVLQARMRKVLVPPPATKADEIAAVSGGMYYSRENPDMPPFVHEGMHFDKGQSLYIIEVMKMFTKVVAPFSGTIDRILMTGEDGTVVQKGQGLFKITPDELAVDVDEAEVERLRRTRTAEYLAAVVT
jgi:acetyl/propionyl-CoA carboxylase alpha subunit